MLANSAALWPWDGHSKADVDHHFGNVSDTLETLKFLGPNLDLTDVFKSVLLATLESSKTKALTKAYASILDNLDDDQDLTFTMIQQACTRKPCRGHDSCNDSRGRDLRDRPGTPRRPHDLLGVARKPCPEPNRPDGAVVSYLCNLLDDNDEKPYRVLKADGCVPKTQSDWYNPDVVLALYSAAQRHMPPTIEVSTETSASDAQSEDSDSASDD